ncbi:MAG TPA: ABC transporter permease [Desulfobulbus sp.]|nr:ABC transporter permease [Desulfobulbus sp.]
MEISLADLLAGVTATAAPLLLAALGETVTEKAGVINLSLDGTILLGAMTGFAVAATSGSLAAGFLAAAATGLAVAAVLSLIGTWLGQSQVAVGFTLTLLCRDLAYFLGSPHARQPGPQLLASPLPLLSRIPLLGPALFNQSLLVYLSIAAIPATWFFLYRTRHGLVLRAVGENPAACWARGIRPRLVQTTATLAGGALVGLAGAGYSLALKPGWGRPQGCEGIGWIALALVIFGGWHPLRVALGAYLFGFLQISTILLQDLFPALPTQVFQVAPFPIMIFTLILIHAGRNARGRKQRFLLRLFRGRPPAALGTTYRQD